MATLRYGNLELHPNTVNSGQDPTPENWKHGPYHLILYFTLYGRRQSNILLQTFGSSKSSIDGSQEQLQARYESGATFRTIRDLIPYYVLDGKRAEEIVKIVANIARNEMKKWKQGKVSTNYSYENYLADVSRHAQYQLRNYPTYASVKRSIRPNINIGDKINGRRVTKIENLMGKTYIYLSGKLGVGLPKLPVSDRNTVYIIGNHQFVNYKP